MNLIVRYLLGGGSFVLALGFMQDRRFDFLRVNSQGDDISLYLASLMIIVAGVTIYTLHRAIAYRLVLPVRMNGIIWKHKLGIGWLEPERTLTKHRLERRAKGDPIQHHFDPWAAELHFLYASAWGWLAAVVVFWINQPAFGQRGVTMASTGALLLIAAAWHD